jgi:4-hydroxybenzoate polyprenyltransferase
LRETVVTAGLRPLLYTQLVKLEHTGFALPFALVGVILASYLYPVTPWAVLWIVVAFTSARFAAMAFNRIVDRDFDARNPRTASREIPAGKLSVREATVSVVASSGVFVLAAGMLNPLCLRLSPIAQVAVLGYSYAKRFTTATHLILGLADGIAPAAGYLAISGEWSRPWTLLPVLSLSVAFWIGGFDILYSLQDIEIDRRLGLRSIPARFGARAARWISVGFHAAAVLCLAAMPVLAPELGAGYTAALLLTVGLIGLEHGLVDPSSPETIGKAFFTVNVWIASAFASLVLIDRLL